MKYWPGTWVTIRSTSSFKADYPGLYKIWDISGVWDHRKNAQGIIHIHTPHEGVLGMYAKHFRIANKKDLAKLTPLEQLLL